MSENLVSWKELGCQTSMIFTGLILLVAVLLLGCTTINVPTPTPTPSPVPAPTPTRSPGTPALTEQVFTLSLDPAKEYDEYTIPIYIKSHQTLQLKWRITEGGEFLWIAFDTPSGQTIGMRADGGFNLHQPTACERLEGTGNIIFSPSDYDWGEGYYYFYPHLTKGTTTRYVKVEVYYWMQD